MAERTVTISDLRWPVQICIRQHAPSQTTNELDETYKVLAKVRANIENVGAQTFYGGEQIETPFTHWITIRWIDWLDTRHAIIRNMLRPDQTVRTDIFRLRRLRELDGQQQWILIEAEQESRS